MAGKGGYRPGAGRPRRRKKHAGPIARAEKRIADHLPTLVDRLFDLADGVAVKETDQNGATRVYTRPPDRASAEYLLNRIMGKPAERLEADVDVNLPIIAVEFVQPDHAEPAPGADEPE